MLKGTSANAGPHYQKLYARVTHIRGNRRSQPSRSAMTKQSNAPKRAMFEGEYLRESHIVPRRSNTATK